MIKKSVTDPRFPVRWGGEGSALTLYFEKFQQNNFMKLKIEKVLRWRRGAVSKSINGNCTSVSWSNDKFFLSNVKE